MAWANDAIKKLQNGKTVKIRPRGSSMTPKVKSGQLVTIEPIEDHSTLKRGDIVLCVVNGSQYLHLIKSKGSGRFLIGNNHGKTNGWTNSKNVFGILTEKEKM